MPEPTQATAPVVIAGGGWSGLAAAVSLSRQNIPVVLLESAPQLGGRARSVLLGDTLYDNGQHLMLGACHCLLTLMQQVGTDPGRMFRRLPLTLQLYRGPRLTLNIRAPAALPAPLHLLAAVVGAQGLSATERLTALRFSRMVQSLNLSPADDISVETLLRRQAQTPALIRKLWMPLCIAIMNTHIELASARLFTAVLQTILGGLRGHADLLIPLHGLSALLPAPCAEYLERRGAQVQLGQRVTGFETDETGVSAVHTTNRLIPCRQLILATPHTVTRRLLSGQPVLQRLADQLSDLGHEPVTTVYLQYPVTTRLPVLLVGFENALAQWVFDRRICDQPGLMAVVISARGEHMQMSHADLIERVSGELANAFPYWPTHHRAHVVRERRATFCARVGIDAIRPGNRTAVNGLWLAGDYTATGLPATLEGAVRSGQHCARAVVQALSR